MLSQVVAVPNVTFSFIDLENVFKCDVNNDNHRATQIVYLLAPNLTCKSEKRRVQCMSESEREKEGNREEEERLVPKDFITETQGEMRFQWDITEIRYLLFRRDIQRRSMGKHNRRDYKGLDARENIHAGPLRGPLRSLGCNRAFPAIFYLPSKETAAVPFFFPHRMPKILTLWKTYGLGRTAKVHEEVRSGPRGKATVTNWHDCAKQVLFPDKFMRDIIWRESRKFRPPPLRKDLVRSSRGKIRTTLRSSRIVKLFFFFDEHLVRFYAKSNIACIWNSRVTHLRCKIEKSYLEFWGNS